MNTSERPVEMFVWVFAVYPIYMCVCVCVYIYICIHICVYIYSMSINRIFLLFFHNNHIV